MPISWGPAAMTEPDSGAATPAPGRAARSRTSFAAVVLAGLAGAALTAVAGQKVWWEADKRPGELVARAVDLRADAPLAGALGLVILAGWGVVLVTRTTGRRIAFGLIAVANLGTLAVVALAPRQLPDQIADQLGVASAPSSGPTGWLIAAGVGAAVGLAVVVVGWRQLADWPSLSSRYDRPTGEAAAVVAADPASADQLTLWRALDAGIDPTATDPGAAQPGDGERPASSL